MHWKPPNSDSFGLVAPVSVAETQTALLSWNIFPSRGRWCSCRIDILDVPSKMVYDVLHDIKCRQEWDTDVIDTHDIIQLAASADVGYYAWWCLKPWKRRDLVTLRSGQVEDGYRAVINFSIKQPGWSPAVGVQDGLLSRIRRWVP
ncbi:START domain-containing protein 10-like isoform X2 [Egretta garzetta]|uniref:START domain-containing protein 10-like isoform X2 n=1 Tax=Egretta garzetta TaxID=188379 RepID=UPI00163BC444|nr:START domain-containing protein 10-like isoform X2 [Egretta garzetta]